MAGKRIGVGFIGLQPGRSWAARAHVPALRSLSNIFDIVGVANSSSASAEAAAAAVGLPKAYGSIDELVQAPEVDVVAVTVKVPHHRDLVKAALEAGKHVYCEWPLGRTLAEAEELAAFAKAKGVLGVVGTQARVAPEIVYLKQLVAEGYVGEVLSTTLVARGGGWGGSIADKKVSAYLLDKTNGATMLTIPVGHTLAALRDVLGEIAGLSAVLATRRATALAMDTGDVLPVTAPDQVLVNGVLASGAPISLHYRGGTARDGDGLLWEINGTDGDIRVSGPSGHTQMVQLALQGSRGEEKSFQPLPVPSALRFGGLDDVVPGNVARLYARLAQDVRGGTHTAPSFDDAVAVHRIIEDIEWASAEGRRTAPNRAGLAPAS